MRYRSAIVALLLVSTGKAYARGKFEPVPPDRKDWYD
jgi:hypothetical protein